MHRISPSFLRPTLLVAMALAAGPVFAQTPNGTDAMKAANDRYNAIKAATGVKPAATPTPTGDPCTVVTLANVQGVQPAVKTAERSTRLETYGINECQWKSGSGEVLMVLKDWYDKGNSAKDDAAGMAELFAGEKGAKNVHIDSFAAVGADNAAYAEVADPAKGIANGGAYVGVRKGQHVIMLTAPGFAGRDHAQAMKALEALGRQEASRL